MVRVVVYDGGATKAGGWKVDGKGAEPEGVVISWPRIFEQPSPTLELPPVPVCRTVLLCVFLHHLARLGIALCMTSFDPSAFQTPHLAFIRPRHGCAADGEVFSFLHPATHHPSTHTPPPSSRLVRTTSIRRPPQGSEPLLAIIAETGADGGGRSRENTPYTRSH